VVNRWLSVRLELMGACIVFVAAVLVAVLLPQNAGLAGLALTSALNLTGAAPPTRGAYSTAQRPCLLWAQQAQHP
jgi:hypothetical protein